MKAKIAALLLGPVLFSCSGSHPDRVLLHAYKAGTVTLVPPLTQYRGLRVNLDKELVANPSFAGIRIDLNTPNAPTRRIGEHPAAVLYFFKDHKYILDGFDERGTRLSRYYGENPHIIGVDRTFAQKSLAKLPAAH